MKRKKGLNKIGLNLPIDKWFNNELKDWVNDLLNKKEDKIFEFLDFNAVQKMLIQHRKQEFNHSLKIWDICCIQSWLKSFG